MIIVVILIILTIFFVIKGTKRGNEIIDDSEPIRKIYNDSNLKPTLDTKVEKGHEIKIVYKDKEDFFIWKCPNCEVENRSTNKKCYVCNHTI